MPFSQVPFAQAVKIARKNGLRYRGKDKAKDYRTAKERIDARIDGIPELDIDRILKQTFGDDDGS